jgi:hypothetical protein
VDSLQDLGFTIDGADIQSGFVKAESATVNKTGLLDFLESAEGSGNTLATAFIETMRPGVVRVRLTFVAIKTTSGTYGQGAREDHPIFDPTLYQRAFSRLDAAVMERTGGPATRNGDITPIGPLGAPVTATVSKPSGALLAAREELKHEGFQILKDDEGAGSLVSAPLGVHLSTAEADCGGVLGIPYLADKRASTDVQYFIDAAPDGRLSVRTAIDGLYRTGYGNADKSLSCTSRGVIEGAFVAAVTARIGAAAQ